MASKIEPRILDAAIGLFADSGYHGMTTRDLARKADVTEGSVYRLFTSKDDLFERALDKATKRLLDPAEFLLTIFKQRQKQDFPSAVAVSVRRWYASLTQPSARIMIQASLGKNEKWRQAARAPLEKTVDILAESMERETAKGHRRKFNSHTVAMALILALFQFKATAASSRATKEEIAQAEGILQHWLRGLSALL